MPNRRIKDSEQHIPAAPEWKVYFDGSFFGHSGRDRAGKEICINKIFPWGDEIWHIPAVYSCSKGLVIDLFAEVDPERISAFIEKWDLLNHPDRDDFSKYDAERIEAENPLGISFNCEAAVNSKLMRESHSCSSSWIPDMPDGLDEVKLLLEHYGLDKSKAWSIHRVCLLWAVKRRPVIKSISISLSQRPISFPAGKFSSLSDGESVTITHPLNRSAYTLTSLETKCDELPQNHFKDDNVEYPRKFTQMAYTISPELDDNDFNISDCERSDQPRQKSEYNFLPRANNAVVIGIIGGATGVAALSSEPKVRIACSSLYFDKKESIMWRFSFREKLREDISIKLL